MKNLPSKVFNSLTIILFAIAIYVPFVITITVTPRKNSQVERRPLVHEFNLSELGDQPLKDKLALFENYFTDQFGYREDIVRLNNEINVRFLSTSPVDNVTIGQNGWLYYSQTLDEYRGLKPFSEESLRLWQNVLEARRDMLAEYGTEYILIITPDKHTIYPEYIPSFYSKVSVDNRLDQLLDYLKANSDIHIVDLRDVLLEAKTNQQIYYRHDTHWNDVGAFIAYQYVMERIQEIFPDKKINIVGSEETRTYDRTGDLVGMLGLKDVLTEPDVVELNPNPMCTTYDAPQNGESNETQCPSQEITAVVFRDSFFTALMPFFAQNFNYVRYYWQSYEHDMVRQIVSEDPPDIFVEQFVERRLDTNLMDITSISDYQQLAYEIKLSEPRTNMATEQSEDGLLVKAIEDNPRLVYELDIIPGEETIGVKIDLTAPDITDLTLYYAREGQSFSGRQAERRIIAPGRNEIILLVSPNESVGKIRVDPGRISGDYIIHSIEVRSSYNAP